MTITSNRENPNRVGEICPELATCRPNWPCCGRKKTREKKGKKSKAQERKDKGKGGKKKMKYGAGGRGMGRGKGQDIHLNETPTKVSKKIYMMIWSY